MSDQTFDVAEIENAHGVEIPPDNSKLAAATIYGGTAATYYLSMPQDDPTRDEVLMKCAFAPDARIAESIGATIQLKHVYGTRVHVTNPLNGEVDECVHTVLIDTNGKTWACTSKGIAKSVAMLLQSKGSPDRWKAPITVQVISIKAKIGMMHALKIVPPAEANGKKK